MKITTDHQELLVKTSKRVIAEHGDFNFFDTYLSEDEKHLIHVLSDNTTSPLEGDLTIWICRLYDTDEKLPSSCISDEFRGLIEGWMVDAIMRFAGEFKISEKPRKVKVNVIDFLILPNRSAFCRTHLNALT